MNCTHLNVLESSVTKRHCWSDKMLVFSGFLVKKNKFNNQTFFCLEKVCFATIKYRCSSNTLLNYFFKLLSVNLKIRHTHTQEHKQKLLGQNCFCFGSFVITESNIWWAIVASCFVHDCHLCQVGDLSNPEVSAIPGKQTKQMSMTGTKKWSPPV